MLRMRRYATGLAAVLLLAQPVALAPVGANAPTYTIEDLGTVDGLVPTVTGINASGQVSGFVFTSTGSRAVRFVDPGGWSYVPGLESLPSDAQDINVYGDLTGYVVTSAGDLRAYRYTATTGVLEFIQPMGTGSYTGGHRHQRVGRGDRLRRHWRSRGRHQVVSCCAGISGAEAAEPERDAGHRVRHQ